MRSLNFIGQKVIKKNGEENFVIATKSENEFSIVLDDGKLGYARGIKDGATGKIIELESQKYDPKDYDVVYIGAPVWASKAANPIISYLHNNEGKFNNVKFFLTAGSSGFESGFKQMEDESIKPIKTLALTTKEVKKGTYNLDSFID